MLHLVASPAAIAFAFFASRQEDEIPELSQLEGTFAFSIYALTAACPVGLGFTLWFMRKKFVGSYVFFSATSRS